MGVVSMRKCTHEVRIVHKDTHVHAYVRRAPGPAAIRFMAEIIIKFAKYVQLNVLLNMNV